MDFVCLFVFCPWKQKEVAKILHETKREESENTSISEPVAIIPGLLFLSSFHAASKIPVLKYHKITHVVRLCPEMLQDWTRESPDIKYTAISARDYETYDIMQHLDTVLGVMAEAAKSNTAVLVHCFAGVNRSGTLVTAAYMKHTRTPLFEAVRYVKSKRDVLMENEGFQRQLVVWASKEGLL